jgi:hypothetical protein
MCDFNHQQAQHQFQYPHQFAESVDLTQLLLATLTAAVAANNVSNQQNISPDLPAHPANCATDAVTESHSTCNSSLEQDTSLLDGASCLPHPLVSSFPSTSSLSLTSSNNATLLEEQSQKNTIAEDTIVDSHECNGDKTIPFLRYV